MKNELDSRFVLSVFEKIRQHGVDENNVYRLEGVEAYTDMDGYTVFIEDAQVALRFGFHNQYHYEYDKSEHREQFEKKLKYINEHYD
ncbi:hypothetical protein HMF8227_02400 [Saliniradius amylolyticus]|uniref:DUF3081 domain-containing protein n=1 Tax=Saliniradius amylolyticus TaxID=2183582 RepID=A0A2S2E5N9_9ALTE|nr:DUF3081 family protein [Saliniradius amylolyticus]AWL12852.1 hypothetical protein HMF8227_02400 [Saliniradius amylolyticus]